MRGSVKVHAIGKDVASSSPLRLRAPPALDMMRYQRLSPDCLPLGNGGGGGGPVPRKPASRTSYKDDDAATDGSRLASYLAACPAESKPLRARAPAPAPPSSAGRSPARDQNGHHHHHASDSSDNTSPSSTGGGVGDVFLQWGHNKRSRGRRDSAAAAPSAQRRQPGVGVGGGKIQRRASAPPEKLMPPPPPAAGSSYTRGSNLRSASSFASRSSSASAVAAGDARHGGHHPPLHHHHRSVEERSGGGQKRSSPDKMHKSAMDAVLHMESKNHHHHHESPLMANGSVAGEKLGVERFELPRIYISLSRKEKEDDFLAMKGTKLPQRPKKRAKIVDKSLQFVFPGMWLSDLTKGRYEVREKKCVKKKRRGLKGMESMDSDSE
ncbi:hypothetical protein PR202_ga10128 [Eleusine coracana subsp. coracana]|uniref:Uncharacterized protein n=1 Tax=Eleusine coracana subsp. coracana TaxID=191504 RepID=A0AAV5C5V6_ELECO|nr:hypothetical protein QOZ80_1AG0028680 [Eleusine coracana subsp. coracana]GJM93563.1 hypothetical protein PR202_ga10128 [Eleusine coracana subsp. coracana]